MASSQTPWGSFIYNSQSIVLSVVPEPHTGLLVALGLLAVVFTRKRPQSPLFLQMLSKKYNTPLL